MMFPAMQSSFPPTSITTGQIQNYLDENKKLILAILDNQNMGKLAECAQYQAQLQKNLMYLAAIADSQPQTPTIPTQMSPHTPMQQGGFYMQQQQHPMAQQQGILPPRGPHFNSPHPLQNPQATRSQGQMGPRPNMGTSNSRLNDVLGGAGGNISISKQEDKAGSDAHRGNGDGEETQ